MPQAAVPFTKSRPPPTDACDFHVRAGPRAERQEHGSPLPCSCRQPPRQARADLGSARPAAPGVPTRNPEPVGLRYSHHHQVDPVEQRGNNRGQLPAWMRYQCEPACHHTDLARSEQTKIREAHHSTPRTLGRRSGQQGEQQRCRSAHRHRAASPQATPGQQVCQARVHWQHLPRGLVGRSSGQPAGRAHPVERDQRSRDHSGQRTALPQQAPRSRGNDTARRGKSAGRVPGTPEPGTLSFERLFERWGNRIASPAVVVNPSFAQSPDPVTGRPADTQNRPGQTKEGERSEEASHPEDVGRPGRR